MHTYTGSSYGFGYLSLFSLRFIFTLRAKLSGTVYCNPSCLFVCGSVTTITRNCVHRSSPGVEQAMKNWEGNKFLQLPPPPPLFQFAPHLLGHVPFLHCSWGHSCCDHNESESCNICRQCVDQQTDSLVFTEFQSDRREWSHWKVGGQRPILAPLHRNLEGHSPYLPYSLFHPWSSPNGVCRWRWWPSPAD